MAIKVQIRRGTSAQNDSFKGAEGELTYETNTHGLRVHDNNKTGGYKIPTVIEEGTDGGNRFYRLYSNGWIEQWGLCTATQYNSTTMNVEFIKNMANTDYVAFACPNTPNHQGTWSISARCAVKEVNGMSVHGANNASSAYTGICSWFVRGIAASS